MHAWSDFVVVRTADFITGGKTRKRNNDYKNYSFHIISMELLFIF